MAKTKANPDNANKNHVELPADFEFEGKKVLKVMHVVIGEDGETSYKCIFEDGSQALVPSSAINQ